MKHLLNGFAIAAALAIAAPVWAQAPMTPSAPKAAAEAPSTYAPPAKHAYKQRHKRPMHYAARHGHKRYARGGGGGDQMTDQLNREELARIQGGGGAPMGGPPEGAGPGQGGPRPSGR
jgi:hypothetical protein